MIPALWNRFPLLEYDTGGYLARWYEGYLVPSRPAPYGLFLNVGSFFDFWPNVLLQTAATVWTLTLLMRAQGLREQPVVRMTIFVLLAGVTTLPWLTGVLLTDIFAGLAVIALYLLVFKSEDLSLAERGGLICVAAFAIATHSATLLLFAALTFAIVLMRLMIARLVPKGAAVRALATLLLGLLVLIAGNFVVTKRLAWTPGGYGIVFGRLLEDGVVGKYLEDHCPNPRLRLCAHRAELPRNADVFLWGHPLFNQLGRFDGLGDEMRTIVIESVKDYPLLNLETAARAALRQLVSVRSGEGVLNTIWHTYGMIEKFTPWNLPAMRAARQQHGEIGFDAINTVHVPVAIGSMLLLLVLIVSALARRRAGDTEIFAFTVAAALIANACILGPLSNPHDRYGARMVWLAPLAVMLWAVRALPLKQTPGGGNRRAL